MSSQSVRNIFFLCPYPVGSVPGQRFRYEQYIQLLADKDFKLDFFPFLDPATNEILYKKGHLMPKFFGLIYGFIKRFSLLFVIHKADYVFIFREATPIGPPFFEWIISKAFRKKVIYDFDDAIWITDKLKEGRLEKFIRWRSKVESICSWSYKVSCGNEYLCNYARQFNKNVVLNPTTIDTVHLHNPDFYPKPSRDVTTIGWTGSHSTLKYLDALVPVISQLEQKYQIRFLVIADKKPDLELNSLEFLPWKETTEALDLLQIDIGVMPLPDDEWSRGKCGFKALQYLALEIPAIISPVGVNKIIVTPDVNGYLCESDAEWYNKLELLINDQSKRNQLGKAGRLAVEKRYSMSSNSANFLSLFE